MLMHSCWSIVFNMLSGFDLNSKRSKNHLEMELKILFGKRKGNTFLLHFLISGLLAISLLAQFPPPAQLPPPAGPLGFPFPSPASSRAGPAWARQPLSPHRPSSRLNCPAPQPLPSWPRVLVPPPTSHPARAWRNLGAPLPAPRPCFKGCHDPTALPAAPRSLLRVR